MKYMSHLAENRSVESPVILDAVCIENGKTIIRSVRLMKLTPENIAKFWNAAKQYRTIFRFEIGGDFKKFLERFVKESPDGELMPTGLFWVVDDFVGVFYLTDIDIGIDAVVHYSFFDGRHNGREALVKKMLSYGFNTLGFRRLTSEIPLWASPQTHNFVEHTIGFRKEGRKRFASELNGTFYDLNIYGLLREDIPK